MPSGPQNEVTNSSGTLAVDSTVFAGGIWDITTDATLSNTALLRATGKASVYVQGLGLAWGSNDTLQPDSDGILTVSNAATSGLNGALKAFQGDGAGIVELFMTNVATIPTSEWNQPIGNSPWQAELVDLGWKPKEATLNLNGDSEDLTNALAMKAAANQLGISTVLPFISPNGGIYGDFSTDPYWSSDRAIAEKMGGLAIDSPSNYFFQQGTGYQETVESEIRMMNSLGLPSLMVLSPYDVSANGRPASVQPNFWPDPTFLSATESLVGVLEAANALPSQWVVENYGGGPNTQPIGSDTTTNDINEVALWVAENAPTSTEPTSLIGLNAQTTTTVSSEPPNPACFLAGTLIRTPSGETVVEKLKIGDAIVGIDGLPKMVKWIGRRTYSKAFWWKRPAVQPVVLRASCILDGIPFRDLFVSRDHGIFLDGVIIPAKSLTNGYSICQFSELDQDIHYFHIELDTHCIVFANGCAVESFVDRQSRKTFDNYIEYVDIHRSHGNKYIVECAPRIEGGEHLDRLRQKICGRMQETLTSSVQSGNSGYEGCVDEVKDRVLRGWAFQRGSKRRIEVVIFVNDTPLRDIVADTFREDLLAAGIGDGCHAFEFNIPAYALPANRENKISVLVKTAKCHLTYSPLAATGSALEVKSAGVIDHDELGCVDEVTRVSVRGWLRQNESAFACAYVLIFVDGGLKARVCANQYREDLENAGIGHGSFGFHYDFPRPLPKRNRHLISVVSANTGREIGGSSFILRPSRASARQQKLCLEGVALPDVIEARPNVRNQTDKMPPFRAKLERSKSLTPSDCNGRPQVTDSVSKLQNILVIASYFPECGMDAGSNALIDVMTKLVHIYESVTFTAVSRSPDDNRRRELLSSLGIRILPAGLFQSTEELLLQNRSSFDGVMFYKIETAMLFSHLVHFYLPDAAVIYMLGDLHYLRTFRQAVTERRRDLLHEALKLRIRELTAVADADVVITHSSAEAAVITREVKSENVHVVPWEVEVHNTMNNFEDRAGIAFIGAFGHEPNVDAVFWLVKEIMPLVWAINENIKVDIVGKDAPIALSRLASKNVVFRGHVADLRIDVFNRVRASIAPLRFGAGIKGKVLDSFGAGIPCVMSGIAAEGLLLSPLLKRLICRDASSMAQTILDLHSQRDLNRQMSDEAASFIAREYNRDVVSSKLQAAIELPRLARSGDMPLQFIAPLPDPGYFTPLT